MVPGARGVGFAQVIGTASVVSYYCVLIALAIYYLVISCQATLPWTVCWDQLQRDNVLCMAGKLVGNTTNSSLARGNMVATQSSIILYTCSHPRLSSALLNNISRVEFSRRIQTSLMALECLI